ncbi:hypothetical protein AVEN_268785-1 [Araneus ventricosus]|uniref:Uncharacterized protein n=1 Tax=Araneus ventricosus TaxID=182803 RepID=A0A4Y2JQT3_ARAVE|nr:hypothetical protein AVEN_268785-1 [Araneus ventricosus]
MRSKKQTERQLLLMESSLAYPQGKEKKAETQKEGKNLKGDQTLGYLGVVKPVTPKEDVPLRGLRRDQIFFYPYDMAYGSGPTAPPTTEPNKGRQPPALGIPNLGAYLGASRNLYAQSHPRGQ